MLFARQNREILLFVRKLYLEWGLMTWTENNSEHTCRTVVVDADESVKKEFAILLPNPPQPPYPFPLSRNISLLQQFLFEPETKRIGRGKRGCESLFGTELKLSVFLPIS